MYKYHNLNPISQVGLDEFTKDYAPVAHRRLLMRFW